MPVPVAVPAPNRSLPVLFGFVALAVVVTRLLLTGADLWPSVWMGLAAATGATVITWVVDRRAA